MKKAVPIVLLAAALATGWLLMQDEEPQAVAPAPLPESNEPAPAVAADVVPVPPPVAESLATARNERTWVVGGCVMQTGLPYPQARGKVSCFAGYELQGDPRHVAEFTCDDAGAFTCPLPEPEQTMTLVFEGAMPRHFGRSAIRVVGKGDSPPQDVELLLWPCDLTVTGTITDAEQRPVQGAWVAWQGDPVAADAAGRYRIELASSGGQVTLRAGAPGFATAWQNVPVYGDPEVQLDFVLARGVLLRGRVTDERGVPLADASVATYGTITDPVRTGADGSWLLDCVDGSRTMDRLVARKAGYLEAKLPVDLLAPQPEYELVLGRGVRVYGRVTGPDGAPVRGAGLTCGPDSFDRQLEAMARDGGEYEFAAVRPGMQMLVTRKAGLAPDTRAIEVVEGRDLRVDVQLQRGHFLQGIVVDEGRKPAPGVTINVLVRRDGRNDRGDYIGIQVRTGRDGSFRLEGLPQGVVNLEAHAPKLVRLLETDVAVDRADVRLYMRTGAQIAGRVLDAETLAPVRDFRIRFVQPALIPGERPLASYRTSWEQAGHAFRSADGSWSTAGDALEPGTVTGVEATAKGYAPRRNRHVVAEIAPDPEACVLLLSRGGTITGRVVEQRNGRAVASARVMHFDEGRPLADTSEDAWRPVATTTAADGSFSLTGVPPGEGFLAVEVPGRPRHRDGPFFMPTGGAVERVVLLPSVVVASILLLDPEGVPLADPKGTLQFARTPHGMNATSDRGRLLFTGTPAVGGWHLCAYGMREGISFCFCRELQLEGRPDQQFELRGADTCVVRGRIAGATAEDRFRVTAMKLRGEERYQGESVGADFELRGLAPGDYRLLADTLGRSREPRSGFAMFTASADVPAQVEVTLRARRGRK